MSLSLAVGVEEFLASLSAERGLAANTLAAYRRDLRDYLAYLGDDEPSAGRAVAYVAELHAASMKPATVARKVAALRGLHRFLVAEQFASEDPTVLLDSPRLGSALPKALQVDEVERLLAAPVGEAALVFRDRALLEFMYATGVRVTEAVSLDLDALDLEDRTALVTGKGNRQRLVPVGRFAVDAIGAYLPHRMKLKGDRADSGAVFLNGRGGTPHPAGSLVHRSEDGSTSGHRPDESVTPCPSAFGCHPHGGRGCGLENCPRNARSR